MKKLTLALLLIFSCATAWAADFDKGLAAYKAGDFATALAEFKPLAEQGDAELQFILSQMYESGTGVLADAKEGIRWLKLAAENGHGPAQFLLGQKFRLGIGVKENRKEAVKWYTIAAEQGNTDSQGDLAVMYAVGYGVIQDDVYAHMWANIAASDGSENARTLRGNLVKKMTPKDISKAQDLARECVKKNYKDC